MELELQSSISSRGGVMSSYCLTSLLRPEIYPDLTGSVLHLQTHISHLFMTDHHAYKVKKPVNFGFLDFTSLEKRRHFCHEELRLNRRLSPDVYLGVVELRDDGAGGLCFSGDGDILEYAVKMRRLPDERMMARLLDAGQVDPHDVEMIAEVVAAFHAVAATDTRIASFGSLAAIRNNWLENLRQTGVYCGVTLSAADHCMIGDWALTTLELSAGQFEERVRSGFIRECDGDLHSENICLDGQVHIFDCIEFNEQFRFTDTAADVAFLSMDLENHGRRDLAELFVSEYVRLSGDVGLSSVLLFYQVNRAFIRGKVESFRLDDPLISDQEKQAAAGRAQRFFRLSRGYLLRQRLPVTLLVMCGLTGYGKSALAEEFCFQLGVMRLQSDRERKSLAGVEVTDHGAPIYDTSWNQATYARLAALAEAELAMGRTVVVDATFQRKADRLQFARLAADLQVPYCIVELSCSAEVVHQRIIQRGQDHEAVSDGTWQVFLGQRAVFEAPDEQEGRLIRVDAEQPVTAMVEQLLAGLNLLDQGFGLSR